MFSTAFWVWNCFDFWYSFRLKLELNLQRDQYKNSRRKLTGLKTNWFTKKKSSKPFPMNWIKPLLRCLDTRHFFYRKKYSIIGFQLYLHHLPFHSWKMFVTSSKNGFKNQPRNNVVTKSLIGHFIEHLDQINLLGLIFETFGQF